MEIRSAKKKDKSRRRKTFNKTFKKETKGIVFVDYKKIRDDQKQKKLLVTPLREGFFENIPSYPGLPCLITLKLPLKDK